MTQMPEAVLAREAEVCYATIAVVTDRDAGADGRTEAVTADEVIRMFRANQARLRPLLLAAIASLPEERSCTCGSALADAALDP
jgi:5'-methylthioadenosine phosphorylase